jgi:hypothetical protein
MQVEPLLSVNFPGVLTRLATRYSGDYFTVVVAFDKCVTVRLLKGDSYAAFD